MKKEGVAFLFVIFFVIFFVGGCKAGTTETPFPDTKNIPDPVSVAIISAPSNAFVGEAIPISWGVEGVEKTITHTAIHYDYEPHADKLFRYVTMTEGEKEYPHFTKDFYDGNFKMPRNFTAKIIPDREGIIYYRAHAVVDGKHYWTDEKIIIISYKS